MDGTTIKDTVEMVFKEYSAYVYKTALFLTRSRTLAEDITQETFLQVFRKYYTYDTSKHIRPWIYKITLNTTRNMLRKQRWLKLTGKLPENSDTGIVENTVLKNEEDEILWRAINRLTMKSREIITLHFYSGLKLNEISQVLDIPLGTCKSRLNSALNALRKQLPSNEFDFLEKGEDQYETI